MAQRDVPAASGEDGSEDGFRAELLRFSADLTTLRIAHGSPSLQVISRLAPRDRPLSPAAVSEVLSGKRLPSLDFAVALIRTLLTCDAPPGVPQLGRDDPRLRQWRTRWQELQQLRTRQRRAAAERRRTAERLGGTNQVHCWSLLRRDFGCPVLSLALSPDGGSLAVGLADGRVLLHDPRTGVQVGPTLSEHTQAVHAVAFSPDGTLLATGSNDETMRVWSTTDGRPVSRLDNAEGVRALAFSPDGRRLASGGRDYDAKVYDIGGLRIGRAAHGSIVYGAAFSPDGRHLVTCDSRGGAKLWSAESLSVLAELELGQGLGRVAFAPDSSLFATVQDVGIRLWDPQTHALVAGPLLGNSEFTALSFAPDSRLLASACSDGTVWFWNPRTGIGIGHMLTGHMLTGHTGAVSSLAVSADLLVTGSPDHTVRIWQWEEGSLGLSTDDRAAEALRLRLRQLESENLQLRRFVHSIAPVGWEQQFLRFSTPNDPPDGGR
jgi:WD40 repeat protein